MKQQTLKRQILIISGTLIIATILLCICFIYVIRIFIRNDIEVHNDSMMTLSVDQIYDTVNLPLSLIENVNYFIEDNDIGGAAVSQHLETVRISYPYFKEIHLIDHEGYIINTAPFDDTLIGYNTKFEPYYIELDGNEKEIYWSEIYISRNTGNPTISVTISENDYLIAADLDLKDLPIDLSSNNFFDEIYSISILDKWGTYIIDDDQTKVMERQRYPRFDNLIHQEMETEQFEQTDYIYNMKRIEDLDWYIVFEFDQTHMYRSVEILTLWAILIWVIIVGGTAILLRKYFIYIYRDINVLKRKTHSIIENRSVELEVARLNFIELDGFNRDFDYMMEILKKRETEINELNSYLETQIRERTYQLEELNTQLEEEIMEKEIAQHETELLNESLEKKVKDRTEELEFLNGVLEHAAAKAEEANHSKSKFLSIMSHEMRTPLNGIKGFLQMLNRSKLDDEQKELTTVISSSTNSLLDMINDILDVEKFASGRMTFSNKPVVLEMAIKRIVEPYRRLAISKNLDFRVISKVRANLSVNIDIIKFEQVLNNLLSNAIKFTDYGYVHFDVSVAEENNQYKIQFAVKDTGIGIQDEIKPYLFVPFSQANAEIYRRYGGSGLGLSICKEIVRYYNGDIAFTSVYGKGSTFYGYIHIDPVTKYEEEQLKDVSLHDTMSDSHELRNRYIGKILVAEDNEINQKLIKKFFDQHGLNYMVVDNGVEAVKACLKEDISLVFMDCQMPIMDGLEATRRIRKEKGNDMKIIAMTAYASKEDKRRCIEAGMDLFISKPVDLDHLEAMLGLEPVNEKVSVDEGLSDDEENDGNPFEKEAKRLMNRVHFDYETTCELLHTFIHQIRNGLNEIEQDIRALDFEKASRKAHQLNGAAGAIRIQSIKDLIGQIEGAIHKEDSDLIMEYIQFLMNDPLITS